MEANYLKETLMSELTEFDDVKLTKKEAREEIERIKKEIIATILNIGKRNYLLSIANILYQEKEKYA